MSRRWRREISRLELYAAWGILHAVLAAVDDEQTSEHDAGAARTRGAVESSGRQLALFVPNRSR